MNGLKFVLWGNRTIVIRKASVQGGGWYLAHEILRTLRKQLEKQLRTK